MLCFGSLCVASIPSHVTFRVRRRWIARKMSQIQVNRQLQKRFVRRALLPVFYRAQPRIVSDRQTSPVVTFGGCLVRLESAFSGRAGVPVLRTPLSLGRGAGGEGTFGYRRWITPTMSQIRVNKAVSLMIPLSSFRVPPRHDDSREFSRLNVLNSCEFSDDEFCTAEFLRVQLRLQTAKMLQFLQIQLHEN